MTLTSSLWKSLRGSTTRPFICVEKGKTCAKHRWTTKKSDLQTLVKGESSQRRNLALKHGKRTNIFIDIWFIWLTYLSTFTVQFSSRWFLCARKSPYVLHRSLRSFPYVALKQFQRSSDILTQKLFFFFAWSVSSWGQCWFALSKWRAENGSFMMYLTHATHASMVYDITYCVSYTYCWAQNGSTRSHGFGTFKHRFSTNRTRNRVKNFCESVFYLTVTRMLLRLNSPLTRHYDLKV